MLSDQRRLQMGSLSVRAGTSDEHTDGGLVSVVIPCYNQAHFLAEAIESVLAQTYPHIEVVVVDDGSTDNTSAVLARYPGVRGIRQDNQGLAAARNAGLRDARGEYVHFLDADDLLLPHALEVGVEALRQRPRAAFTFGHTMFLMEDGSMPPEPHRPRLGADPYAQLLAGCPIMGPPLFRRSLFDTIALYDRSLRAAEDYDLYYRVAREHPIHCHESVVFVYRRHGGSMTSASSRVLLRGNMTALRRQRRFVWCRPRYWSAYRTGVGFWTGQYGYRLAREMNENIQQHRWLDALRDLGTLIRWWPRGAIRALGSSRTGVPIREWCLARRARSFGKTACHDGRKEPMAFVDVLDVADAVVDYELLVGGHIDLPRSGFSIEGSGVEVAGWVLGRRSPAVAVEVAASDGLRQHSKLNALRPDLAEGFPTVANAERGGFRLTFPMPPVPTLHVEVRGVLQDGTRASLGRISLRRRWRQSKDPELASMVSVVIPCYNQAHHLADAIESVLEQTHPNVELCVVDDGSTDNTRAVVARYPMARYVCQPNEGAAAARNRGLRETNGDYLVFLDADDVLLPVALATGLEALTAHPEAAFVFGDAIFVMEDGSEAPRSYAPRLEGDLYAHLLAGCPITHGGAVMYRRAVFERTRPFDTNLGHLEDYDLYHRVAREFPIWHHSTVVAKYRRHGTNTTSTNPRGALADAMRVLHRQRAFAKRTPEHWRAYRAGTQYWSEHLGLILAREVQQSIGHQRWREALGGLATLARWWPPGVKAVLRAPRRMVEVPEWGAQP